MVGLVDKKADEQLRFIHRRETHLVDYTEIDNEAFRRGMSLKAIGLLCFMLSHDDCHRFTIEGLSRDLGCGKSTIRTAVKELVQHGYIIRSKVKGLNSSDRWHWDVYEMPEVKEEVRR